jgi:hypothetical protein
MTLKCSEKLQTHSITNDKFSFSIEESPIKMWFQERKYPKKKIPCNLNEAYLLFKQWYPNVKLGFPHCDIR